MKDTASQDAAAQSAEAPPAQPAPSGTVIYVRPPEGLAQGKYDVPAYLVGIAAGVLVAGVAGFFLLRYRRARQQVASGSPHSLPPSGPVSSRR